MVKHSGEFFRLTVGIVWVVSLLSALGAQAASPVAAVPSARRALPGHVLAALSQATLLTPQEGGIQEST